MNKRMPGPVTILAAIALASGGVHGADPFLEFHFDAPEELDSFFNPSGIDLTSCPGGFPVVPSGFADVSLEGDVQLTNSTIFGVNLLLMRPAVVQAEFPDPRDFKARVKFSFETASQLGISVKLRGGVDEALSQADSQYERGYTVSVFPEDAGVDFPNGALSIVEFAECHRPVDHDDWPNADIAGGFALVDAGVVISRESWYWAEVGAFGNEDGGPVTISARVWADGSPRPLLPGLVVVDPTGLMLDDATRAAEREIQFGLGVSLDYPDPSKTTREPNGTMRVDDISLAALEGCPEPPMVVERVLWDPTTSVEGEPLAIYGDGESYTVRVRIAHPEVDRCGRPGAIHVRETVPDGWVASSPSDGGVVVENSVTWDVPIVGEDAIELSYDVIAMGTGQVEFSGLFVEPPGDFLHEVRGESHAVTADATGAPALSDFMSIQHWLVLGPFERPGGGAPGEAEIARDYLTDGAVTTEMTIRPVAGLATTPDFGGAAASTGLAPNTLGRNAGGVPRWLEWRDRDDGDDRIDFESIYGEQDDVMCYAVTYLDVASETIVHFGVSSNDSIQLLLDGESIHIANVARNAEARFYQDTPVTSAGLGGIQLAAGTHVLMAKIFEGGALHNFRVGFVTAEGNPLFDPPPGVDIRLAPGTSHDDTRFVRGDSNDDGEINLTDGVFVLNYLFTGGDTPTCMDAADTNGDNVINLTDGTYVLNFLFLGGDAPPEPGTSCGADPDDDELPACATARCG